MYPVKPYIAASSLMLASLSIAPAAHAQHAGDVWVGRSDAGQLKIAGFDVAHNAIPLAPSGMLFNGWADNDPGFDRVLTDDPASDLFTLDAGAQISIVVVEIDDAFRGIKPVTFEILDGPGDQVLLGNENLHIHLTWHINSDDPLFDPAQYLWNATFKLIDTGSTGYADSEPFTMHFVNIDCTSGDVNGDDVVDESDVGAFVGLLLDSSGATIEEICSADFTFDGQVDGADIAAFVDRFLEGE